MRRVPVLLLVVAMMAGCGNGNNGGIEKTTTTTTTTTTQPPTTTTTTQPPTTTTTVDATVSDTVPVTFDGTECTVSGSGELPIGFHSFALTDLSEMDVQLRVDRLVGDKTVQDMLDYLGEPGVWKPQPSWVEYTRVPTRTESDTGYVFTTKLPRDGRYFVYVYKTYLLPDDEKRLWVCSPPLQVTEEAS